MLQTGLVAGVYRTLASVDLDVEGCIEVSVALRWQSYIFNFARLP